MSRKLFLYLLLTFYFSLSCPLFSPPAYAQLTPSQEQSADLSSRASLALTAMDYAGAYVLASQATQIDAKNAEAWNLRAIADNKLGHYQDAILDSTTALKLVPDNAAALVARAWALGRLGHFQEALADANQTLKLEPNNSFAYQDRALALAGIKKNTEALEDLRRSAELNPAFATGYQEALRLPAGRSLLALLVAGPKVPSHPAAAGGNPIILLLLTLSGGLLTAMGIINILSVEARKKTRQTVRRVLGSKMPRPKPASDILPAPYEMIRPAGSGSMGLVYEARDTSLDRHVAVKKLRREIRSDPKSRQQFIQEARIVAMLKHPNIVGIYGIIDKEQDVFIIFEWVKGRTLAQLLREQGPLPFAQARDIFRKVSEAVEYAHDKNVIHRDLSPSNIMLTSEGLVKVMDFSVARIAKDSITKSQTTTKIVGTPPYIAPEQEMRRPCPQSDVFSLGVCFYEMLCGQLPFKGQGAVMSLNKFNGRHIPISRQIQGGIPAGLDEVLAQAISPDLDARYKTPLEFANALGSGLK